MRLVPVLAAVVGLLLAGVAGAAPPPVDAEAYLVQNAATGEVLAARDERERLPIASITKLMTALVALERADVDDVVTVDAGARRRSASRRSISGPGERVALGDLIRAALIQSANDAADAIAIHIGGGSMARFVALMNARAAQLGLTDTHFATPTGSTRPATSRARAT